MTDAEQLPDKPATPPQRQWPWRATLIVSLALNLLAVGAIAAHFAFGPRPHDRIEGFSSMQILPRKFLTDLPGGRHTAVLEILRQHRAGFRDRYAQLRAATEKIADALDAEPYDPAAVTVAIDGFVVTGRSMIDGGAGAVKEVIATLSDDERHLLAKRIRERATWRRK